MTVTWKLVPVEDSYWVAEPDIPEMMKMVAEKTRELRALGISEDQITKALEIYTKELLKADARPKAGIDMGPYASSCTTRVYNPPLPKYPPKKGRVAP